MKILLLAGTAQSRAIAAAMEPVAGVELIASLAGITRRPHPMPCPVRIGGFGGEAGFRAYLVAEKIDAVIDATHPFAARMSQTAAAQCAALGVKHLQLLRPQWPKLPGDNWLHVADESDVAGQVPDGATVFLATGPHHVMKFSRLRNCTVICRRIDPPKKPFPFENGRYLVARPPFLLHREIALFKKLEVDWLVLRNAGGEASRPKLDAARALGIRVAMIFRPEMPTCARVDSVSRVLDQVRDWASDLKLRR